MSTASNSGIYSGHYLACSSGLNVPTRHIVQSCLRKMRQFGICTHIGSLKMFGEHIGLASSWKKSRLCGSNWGFSFKITFLFWTKTLKLILKSCIYWNYNFKWCFTAVACIKLNLMCTWNSFVLCCSNSHKVPGHKYHAKIRLE